MQVGDDYDDEGGGGGRRCWITTSRSRQKTEAETTIRRVSKPRKLQTRKIFGKKVLEFY